MTHYELSWFGIYFLGAFSIFGLAYILACITTEKKKKKK
jgi:hypothetical protein